MAPLASSLAASRRRRTPGLRREELAQLAGLSVDWYTRLEQGRDINPSRETLDAIARVLKLDEGERGHLFYLAKPEPVPHSLARQEKADPAMARSVEVMQKPTVVLSPRYDILAWNQGARRLLVPFDDMPAQQRNLLWLTFHHRPFRERYADIALVERQVVASFRGIAASFVSDPDFDALIGDLLGTSASFLALWARHDVQTKVSGTKRFRTEVGRSFSTGTRSRRRARTNRN